MRSSSPVSASATRVTKTRPTCVMTKATITETTKSRRVDGSSSIAIVAPATPVRPAT